MFKYNITGYYWGHEVWNSHFSCVMMQGKSCYNVKTLQFLAEFCFKSAAAQSEWPISALHTQHVCEFGSKAQERFSTKDKWGEGLRVCVCVRVHEEVVKFPGNFPSGIN